MTTTKPRPTLAAMRRACESFNAAYPIGSTIRVYPGALDGLSIEVRISEPGAYVLAGHTAVVQVTDGHGCIAISHVVGQVRR